jgi:hypothetical protein
VGPGKDALIVSLLTAATRAPELYRERIPTAGSFAHVTLEVHTGVVDPA